MSSESPWILDVTEREFAALLERSSEVPVLIDFWAPWCGPCRTLTPLLIQLADEYAGAFLLAKINTDEQPRLAQAFQIQSIPAVKLISQGRLVDQFDGALPERELRSFLENFLGPAGAAVAPKPADQGTEPVGADALSQAEALSVRGETAAAIEALQRLLEAERAAGRGRAAPAAELLLAELLVESSDQTPEPVLDAQRFEQARHLIEGLEGSTEASVRDALPRDPKKREAAPPIAWGVVDSRRLRSLRGRLALGPQSALRRPSDADHSARAALDRGRALALEGRFEAALEALLESLSQDRNLEEGAAQVAMRAVFDMLGPEEELTSRFRRRMQMALF